jgi:hypothetical protein
VESKFPGRKRRHPIPAFNILPPYDTASGERERLSPQGIHPYVAMMQVAEEDTHDNYLICRGFDTREKRFIDYESGNADKPGIAVAKPYGQRGVNQYKVGEVYVAVLPLGAPDPDLPFGNLGQNSGKAETTVGHPADLDEKLVFLLSDENIYINWMIVEAGTGGGLIECCLAEDHPGRNTVFEVYIGTWNAASHTWTYGTEKGYAIDRRYGVPYPDAGAKGLFEARQSTTYGVIWESVSLDCESPGDCED